MTNITIRVVIKATIRIIIILIIVLMVKTVLTSHNQVAFGIDRVSVRSMVSITLRNGMNTE